MSRFSRAAASLLLVAALAGGNAGCISDPSIKIAGARISNVSLAGVDLTMTMAVHNPNSFDVMVRDVKADVTLADRHRLPTVQVSPNVWLPSDRTTNIDVPVTIPWMMVPSVVQTTLGSQTISYRAFGSANVTATKALEIDFDDWSVEKEGVISRDALVNAAARSIFGNQVAPYDYNRPQGYPQQQSQPPYQQPGPSQQPGQWSQPGPYQQPSQQPGSYQQPGQWSQPGPYQQPGQWSR